MNRPTDDGREGEAGSTIEDVKAEAQTFVDRIRSSPMHSSVSGSVMMRSEHGQTGIR